VTIAFSRNVDLQPHNTLAIAARAEWFVAITDEQQLPDVLAAAHQQQLALTVIGGGSNIVLRGDVPGLVVHIANKGFQRVAEDEQTIYVRVAAGEVWDDWVKQSLQLGYYGLENLSLIPGTVGASPVQNIGAYGVEIGELIKEVHGIEVASGRPIRLSAADCVFAYRDSIFKHRLSGKVIITAVTFRLFKKPQTNVVYPALRELLSATDAAISPLQIREAVCNLRRSKLPDPATIPNAGSFFKNPVISRVQAGQLQCRHPDMPAYPVDANLVKIPAAWLIDRAGWKGRVKGAVAVHHSQALVLTNPGRGKGDELLTLAEEIADNIKDYYGICLEMEPVVIPPQLD
jgi:UDP-N-acetylmuramate dehydrogenase